MAAPAAPASVQVLTSATLFNSVTDFIDGVPFFVLQFKDTAFQAHVAAKEQAQTKHDPEIHDPIDLRETLLWHVAIINRSKRVFTALEALATSPRYASSPHVDFTNVMGYAVLHAQDNLAFLDWLFARFRAPQQRQISCEQFDQLARCSHSDSSSTSDSNKDALAVVQWLHARDYAFPASMMDAAAAHGNLALVRFLHEHSPSGCTTQAMDDAARFGHLDVVQFLHENRTEGCTRAAQGGALKNGHLDVLTFMFEHRSEGCSATAVTKAAANGHLACIQFAHEHNFDGFSVWTMSDAVTAGHLDVVKYLHEHRTEGCMLESLFEAEQSKHRDVVDFLCRHRPMKSPGAAIKEATRRGHVRLAAKLTRGAVVSPWTQAFYYGDENDLKLHVPRPRTRTKLPFIVW